METIRKMTEKDVAVLAQMEQMFFADPWSENALLETCKNPNADIFIIENEELQGYLIAYYLYDAGEIAKIAVNPQYRRQGIGRKLLDELCRICKEKNMTSIYLEVREHNEGARAFYKNYGFVENGVRKNYYQNPVEHAVLMQLEI